MPVEVRCEADADGYRCTVDVSDATGTTHHLVRVSRQDFDRWRRGRSAEELVRDSFNFLLEREPKESILREFDLSVIQRYFPDFFPSPARGRG
jgi:hypothetical protein